MSIHYLVKKLETEVLIAKRKGKKNIYRLVSYTVLRKSKSKISTKRIEKKRKCNYHRIPFLCKHCFVFHGNFGILSVKLLRLDFEEAFYMLFKSFV